VKVWRIATETRQYAANDLSGAGAAKNPGRWNDVNEPIVYCATSIALAVLETAAHIDIAGFPLNRFVVEIDVPDPVWGAKMQTGAAALPGAWNAIPAGRASVQVGSQWLASNGSAIHLVPSVIVEEEWCALLNPGHPDSAKIRARSLRRFEYDLVFRPSK